MHEPISSLQMIHFMGQIALVMSMTGFRLCSIFWAILKKTETQLMKNMTDSLMSSVYKMMGWLFLEQWAGRSWVFVQTG